MTKNSKLMIKSKSLQSLTLNEAFDSTPNNKKYIFSGVFTACSVPGHDCCFCCELAKRKRKANRDMYIENVLKLSLIHI